jgi:hypothetical protein
MTSKITESAIKQQSLWYNHKIFRHIEKMLLFYIEISIYRKYN